MKDDFIGIIDVIAPPDEVLGSPFGSYDGDIYNKYITRIMSAKDCFRRVDWWKEINDPANRPTVV
jgi:hypothetical protein